MVKEEILEIPAELEVKKKSNSKSKFKKFLTNDNTIITLMSLCIGGILMVLLLVIWALGMSIPAGWRF